MRVWTVCEGKAGTLTQCVGVARHIDQQPHNVILQRKLQRWRQGLLSPYWSLPRPQPDIIVSCGSMATRHVFAIARACRRPPLTVHLQRPDPDFTTRYDMVFVPRHDWTEDDSRYPNFFQMLGAPHKFTATELAAERPAARQIWSPDGSRVVAVFVGGPNGVYSFDQATINHLMQTIASFAADGLKVLVSASRRSDPAMLDRLLTLQSERITVWNGQGPNPYAEFLAAADVFLITKDTITMVCEALTTARPVYIYDLPKTPGTRLDEFEWFHNDMSATQGYTRAFVGQLDGYVYQPPDEARRIAELIDEAMSGRPVS